MIYTCDSCHFTFRRLGKIEDCPDCGKPTLREATEKEKDEYKKNQIEFGRIENQESASDKSN